MNRYDWEELTIDEIESILLEKETIPEIQFALRNDDTDSHDDYEEGFDISLDEELNDKEKIVSLSDIDMMTWRDFF
jgi:hypothetical protein